VFFYYPLFAFVAGFSERFAHVIFGNADLTVARALSGADTPEQMLSNGRPLATGSNSAVTAAPALQPTAAARHGHDVADS